MSESHDERRVRLESEYRARIVRKLRAEADRIEAGGPIQCYSVNDELEGELCTITEDEARAELAASGFNYDEQVAKVEAFIGSLYLPCPFCGADGLPCEREHLDHCNTVACSACGAFVEGYTEDEARAAWNRRAP